MLLIKNNFKLKTNNDFKKLILPPSQSEIQQLEYSLINEGCCEPLTVWRNTVLDGHKRYEICSKLSIPFSIQRIRLTSYEDAVVWICTSQLLRTNITDEMKKYLIGKIYEMERIISINHVKELNKKIKDNPEYKPLDDSVKYNATKIRERLGNIYNMSEGSVYRYNVFSDTIDSIYKISPELANRILLGNVYITYYNIVKLRKLPNHDLKKVCRKLSVNNEDYNRIINNFVLKIKYSSNNSSPLQLTGAIKEMPTYDPDADIFTLALTIPSWGSSIKRTYKVADFSNSSIEARSKLKTELILLNESINIMLSAINEVNQ